MQAKGWTLLFHDCIVTQLATLHAATLRAERNDPGGYEQNANVKLFHALSRLIVDVIPSDPSSDTYRQGNTLGSTHRHWRRARIGRRFRLFFRYDAGSRLIVFAWINDESTLRSAGSKSDPYAVFARMLDKGHPPTDWAALVSASHVGWGALSSIHEIDEATGYDVGTVKG